MADVKFMDHTEKALGLMADLAESALEEVCGELESAVARNTAVKTGQTKGSWQHKVTGSKSSGVFEGVVGSPLENAIWEEFGTGEYAHNGDGRKGGWFYVDEEGKGHFTHGKHPRRPFWKAYSTLKNKMIKYLQNIFKGGFS